MIGLGDWEGSDGDLLFRRFAVELIAWTWWGVVLSGGIIS